MPFVIAKYEAIACYTERLAPISSDNGIFIYGFAIFTLTRCDYNDAMQNRFKCFIKVMEVLNRKSFTPP